MNHKPTAAAQNNIFTPLFLSLLVTEILSSLGQVTLTFALPLHLLNLTGSASLYGLVIALALIPAVALTPVGGAVADRLDKRRTMALLDFLTAGISLAYLLLSRSFDLVALTIAAMMLAYGFHALYGPVVQAWVPFIVNLGEHPHGDAQPGGKTHSSGKQERERLTQATGIISQTTSLTTMLGPIFAGVLLSFAGIVPVVIMAGAACLASSVWILLAARTPSSPAQAKAGGSAEGKAGQALSHPLRLLLADFAQAIRFLGGQRTLLVANVLVTFANLVFCAFVNVALPYIVTQELGLSNQLQGLAEGAISAGALAGAVVTSTKPGWFSMRLLPALIALSGLCLLPAALSMGLSAPARVSYLTLLLSLTVAMGLLQCVSVTIISFEQTATPRQLVGKVIGVTMSLSMAAMPLGQALYGPLIDHLPLPALMLAIAVLMAASSLFATRFARRVA
ncbi:Permeases of the major facilitator superfamily [Bifidobacterium actinocoloniiforme DSM 22766]|uniref:Permeases of the major facilitator superfamily n=1 Tax=Bifidobacterium actinocoloniiforme DSM 22766 TaxID=1437605 RepID=A0A086Z071_9BIFI|nr:MFS transporter [Bifidobacterium actinocoloniiforme]AKV55180.1 hypothetical protein AB656_01720 [Bifidobacterium actinocoloniiforme DSM 22766]KFI39921.1 Permeases of the major facilitator superfamily [Bifidobacterium actinocoloniiforme DSM 22766]